jgi:phage shock protein A
MSIFDWIKNTLTPELVDMQKDMSRADKDIERVRRRQQEIADRLHMLQVEADNLQRKHENATD